MNREELIKLLQSWLTTATDDNGNPIHVIMDVDIHEIATEIIKSSLPPAEGAEEAASDLSFTIGLLEAEIDSLKDAYKSDGPISREYSSAILSHKTALKILKGNISQKPLQPTAEGAEEILRKNCNTCYSRSTGEEEVWSSVSSVLIAMQDFATLHAQRIAEKMVEWVSVKDKLPEERENVLCYNGYRISSHNWCKYTDQDDDWFKKTFTHWCKLPKIP